MNTLRIAMLAVLSALVVAACSKEEVKSGATASPGPDGTQPSSVVAGKESESTPAPIHPAEGTIVVTTKSEMKQASPPKAPQTAQPDLTAAPALKPSPSTDSQTEAQNRDGEVTLTAPSGKPLNLSSQFKVIQTPNIRAQARTQAMEEMLRARKQQAAGAGNK